MPSQPSAPTRAAGPISSDVEREARIEKIAAQLDAIPADGQLWSLVIGGVKVRRGGIGGRWFAVDVSRGDRWFFSDPAAAARRVVEAS